jgi:hypothetical protein
MQQPLFVPIDRFDSFCYHLIKSDNIGGIHGQDTDTTD